MKKIFIYYSLSGNGDTVATYLKEKGIVTRKVIPVKQLPSNRILSILSGGFLAFKEYQDKLDNYDSNVKDYDEVIIGSPIWNGRLSCPINTVLNKTNLKNKKLIFILYSGSGNAPKATKKINSLYPNATIINIKEPKNNSKELINSLNKI